MSKVDLAQKVWCKPAKTHIIIYAIIHFSISPLGGLLSIIDRVKLPDNVPEEAKLKYFVFFLPIPFAVIQILIDVLLCTCIRCPKWFKYAALTLIITPSAFIFIETIYLIWEDKNFPPIFMGHQHKLWNYYKFGVIGGYTAFYISQLVRLYLGRVMLKLSELQPGGGWDMHKRGKTTTSGSKTGTKTKTEEEE